MANIIFTNNASSLLAATITDSDLTIQVKPGFGALFPAPSSPQVCYITLEDNAGNVEIVKCTSRATDLLTVVRGQDGTVAQAFSLDITRVELRTTAIILEEFVQVNGDAMTGDLDFATNEIQNAFLTGTTRITGGQTIGTAIRGTLNQTNNELAVPAASGVRATAGGVPIVVNTDDIIALLDTAGVIALDSATIGVEIVGGAYLELQGPTAANKLRISHDDTDLNFALSNTTDVNWSGANLRLISGDLLLLAGDLFLEDNILDQPLISDFAVSRQAVTATTTTALDYEAGQYVELAMAVNIVTFSITNPPITGRYGAVRLRVTQGSGGQTITWPASYKWANGGTEPVLSTGAGEIDFVDLWTDDAGATWYGASAQDFA